MIRKPKCFTRLWRK